MKIVCLKYGSVSHYNGRKTFTNTHPLFFAEKMAFFMNKIILVFLIRLYVLISFAVNKKSRHIYCHWCIVKFIHRNQTEIVQNDFEPIIKVCIAMLRYWYIEITTRLWFWCVILHLFVSYIILKVFVSLP